MDAHVHTGSDGSEKIVASATKEEWADVIAGLMQFTGTPYVWGGNETTPAPNESIKSLIHWLINQGVFR